MGLTALAWFNAWSSSLFFDALAALAAIFPTGRFAAGAMGRVAALAIAAPIVFGIALAFAPTLNPQFEDGTSGVVRNPIGLFEGWSGWPVIQAGVYVAVLASLMVSIGTFLVRYRRARGLERAQGKWLLGALSLMLAAVVFAFAVLLLVDSTGFWMWAPAALAYPLIPVAIGVAVTRYRLYEIDRIVSRTIGWAVSTGRSSGCSRSSSSDSRRSWPRSRARARWRSPHRHSPRSRCSSRSATASSPWWITASTGRATTPNGFRACWPCGFATRRIYRRSMPGSSTVPAPASSRVRWRSGCEGTHELTDSRADFDAADGDRRARNAPEPVRGLGFFGR